MVMDTSQDALVAINLHTMGGDDMCPRCDADMQEIAVDFYSIRQT